MFFFLHSQTKHSIYFLNSHSLTFIRCRVVCRAQMHRLNAERWRGGGGGERRETEEGRRGWREGEKQGGRERGKRGREAMLRGKTEAVVSGGRRRECATVCARREVTGRRKRDGAECRETDGACAPAAMKGGGEERVEEGDAGRRLPSETKETECENAHGGARRSKLFPERHRRQSPESLCGAVVAWWGAPASPSPESQTPPVIPASVRVLGSLCRCNPDVLLAP